MDTLSLVFSLLVALLFGILIGWWFARSGKKSLSDRVLQVEGELRDSQKQYDAARTELQLQHDDYEAKLKTVQVDISKRSADIDAERARIATTVGDYDSRINELQTALAAERARTLDLEDQCGGRVGALEENLQARLVELDFERQRVAALEAQVADLSAAPVAAAAAAAVAVEAIGESGNGHDEVRTAFVDIGAPSAPSALEVDDLTRINGIGPRYAAILASAGITTYKQLAQTDPAELRDIVGAQPWQVPDTPSWVLEAARFENQPRLKVAGDDLIRIEGIGPRYNSLLRAAGITTFAQLAAADDAVLADIIKPKAWQKVDFDEWKQQAALAAAGDWAAFDALQAQLNQRKENDLALIQGLGDTHAAALRTAGIDSFAALAAATPEQVDDIMRKAGVRTGNSAAWITEARLRAKGKRVQRQRTARAGSVKVFEVSCPQDLALVNGVGTVFEERLYNAGIGSFWELAGMPDEELIDILDLKRFQGVDLAAIKADALRLANETNSAGRVWDGTPPDDFEILEGVGQIYERRLYSAGICSYAALAEATPDRLAEICKAPAFHRPDYAFWIAQARKMVATA